MIRCLMRKINKRFNESEEMHNQGRNFLIIKRIKLRTTWRLIKNNCNKILCIQKSLNTNRKSENRNLHTRKSRKLRPLVRLIKWNTIFKGTSTTTSKRQEESTRRERRKIGTHELNERSSIKKHLERERQWESSMHTKDPRSYTQGNSLVSQHMLIEALSLIKICHFLYS